MSGFWSSVETRAQPYFMRSILIRIYDTRQRRCLQRFQRPVSTLKDVPELGSATNSAAQECGYVAGALRHRNDLYWSSFGEVNHEVRTYRPEQNRVQGQVFAPVTDARSTTERFKCVEQISDPAVGSVDTIRSDVLPDIVKIEVRGSAKRV